jgi:hypothetical protein
MPVVAGSNNGKLKTKENEINGFRRVRRQSEIKFFLRWRESGSLKSG